MCVSSLFLNQVFKFADGRFVPKNVLKLIEKQSSLHGKPFLPAARFALGRIIQDLLTFCG